MNRQGSARSGVLFGSILVVVGTVLLLERIGVMPTNLLRHFWPLLWMVVGALLIGSRRGPFAQAWGVVFLVCGAATEASRAGLIHLRFWDFWPVWLISLGVFLLWRALRPPNPDDAALELLESRVSEYAIFGGGDRMVTSDKFEGGNFTAVFGGHEVDLTRSKIHKGTAVLYADAIFGGVSLRVPQTWRVTVHGPAVFGGVENKALPPPPDAPEQHLIVKATAIFGGVDIKN
jgi:predicted membrane protein